MHNFFIRLYSFQKRIRARIPSPIVDLLRHLWDTLGILLVGYILLRFMLAVMAYFVSGQAVNDIAWLIVGACQGSPLGECDFVSMYVAVGAWLLVGFYLLITLGFIVWRWFYLPPVTHEDIATGIAVIQNQIDAEVLVRLRSL